MSDTQSQKTNVTTKSDAEMHLKAASACISPSVNAGMILEKTGKVFNPQPAALMAVLHSKEKAIKKGDLSAIEEMLITQAYTLQSVFTHHMSRAISAEQFNHLQIYSKIALKAQNQCRQTLAVLAEMKNPHRTTFIKNQATNQQINLNQNQTSPEKNLNQPNKLLSEEHHAPIIMHP